VYTFSPGDVGKLFKLIKGLKVAPTVQIIDQDFCLNRNDPIVFEDPKDAAFLYLGVRRYQNMPTAPKHHVFLVEEYVVAIHEHLFCKTLAPILFEPLLNDGNPESSVQVKD